MLDRLPVELLEHILRLAAPLEYTPTKYRERRKLLRNCCLVDQRMKEVAQPMLAEVLVAKSKEDQKHLEVQLGDGRKRGKLVKLLPVEPADWMSMAEVASACPDVVDLRLVEVFQADPGLLSGLSNLRRLVTADSNLFFPPKLVFPNLVELSFFGTGYEGNRSLTAFLTTSTLPRLRILAFSLSDDLWCEPTDRHLPQIPADLLQQLEVIGVDAGDLNPDALSSLRPARVLYDCMASALPNFATRSRFPEALRIYLALEGLSQTSTDLIDASRSLNKFAKLLDKANPPTSLRLLVLPDEVKSDKTIHSSLRSAINVVLEACTKHNVEVIWDEPIVWGLKSDSLMPPFFPVWARNERRREQEGHA